MFSFDKSDFPEFVTFDELEKSDFHQGLFEAKRFSKLSTPELWQEGIPGFKELEKRIQAKESIPEVNDLLKQDIQNTSTLSPNQLAFLGYHFYHSHDLAQAQKFCELALKKEDASDSCKKVALTTAGYIHQAASNNEFKKLVQLDQKEYQSPAQFKEMVNQIKKNIKAENLTARKYFENAAKLGEKFALAEIAMLDLKNLTTKICDFQQGIFDEALSTLTDAASHGVVKAMTTLASIFSGQFKNEQRKSLGHQLELAEDNALNTPTNEWLSNAILRKLIDENQIDDATIQVLGFNLYTLFHLYSHDVPTAYDEKSEMRTYFPINFATGHMSTEYTAAMVLKLKTAGYHAAMLCVNNPTVWQLVLKANQLYNSELVEKSTIGGYPKNIKPLDAMYFQRSLAELFCNLAKNYPDRFQELLLTDMNEVGYTAEYMRNRISAIFLHLLNYYQSCIGTQRLSENPLTRRVYAAFDEAKALVTAFSSSNDSSPHELANLALNVANAVNTLVKTAKEAGKNYPIIEDPILDSKAERPKVAEFRRHLIFQAPPQQKILITHLKQMHNYSDQNKESVTEQDNEDVAYSQFKITQEVLKFLKKPDEIPFEKKDAVVKVMQEGLCTEATLEHKDVEEEKRILEAFPEGLPQQFKDLTPHQKTVLRESHAGFVLLYLGHVDRLYPSATEETMDSTGQELMVLNLFNKSHDEKTFEKMEQDILKLAKEAASESKANNVHILLILGGGHDFDARVSAHRKETNDTSIVFNRNIETAPESAIKRLTAD